MRGLRSPSAEAGEEGVQTQIQEIFDGAPDLDVIVNRKPGNAMDERMDHVGYERSGRIVEISAFWIGAWLG